jgi:hypothetical protein
LPSHRSYDHKIELEKDREFGYRSLYSQNEKQFVTLRKFLLENLDKGFIETNQISHLSPVLFVKKSNEGLRFCIDFRKFNAITRKNRYPFPLIDETLARLIKAKLFTKLNIRQAFHRIRMHPDFEDLITFRTRYGSYKCKVLWEGLTNGPATYQRYMNDILLDILNVYCTVYLNDILIYSENPLEHDAHVNEMLSRLQKTGFQCDIKKCEFNVKRTKYLDFIVIIESIEIDPEKVTIVKNWKLPQTVKGMQFFLSFCNFYRHFIRDYKIICKSLTRLTKNRIDFIFLIKYLTAFKELKRRLVKAPIFFHYHLYRESKFETDISNGVIARILL